MVKKHIFISYKSEEKADAITVRNFLIEKGFDYWMDEQGIFVGENYAEKIDTAIKESMAIVLVMSEKSVNSAHVQNEIILAAQKNIPVLAFVIREFDTMDAYNFNFSIKERYDAFDDMDEAFEKMYNQLLDIKRSLEENPQTIKELLKLWASLKKEEFLEKRKAIKDKKERKRRLEPKGPKLYKCFPLNLTPYSKAYSLRPNVRLSLGVYTVYVLLSLVLLFVLFYEIYTGLLTLFGTLFLMVPAFFATFLAGINVAGLLSFFVGKIKPKEMVAIVSVITGFGIMLFDVLVLFAIFNFLGVRF